MQFKVKDNYNVEDMIALAEALRADDGCEWDREQTHTSIRKDLLEETYEVVEAIDKQNDVMLCEELGDLLWQVVFHSRIAEEEGAFDITKVADGLCKKLVMRHPHVFGSVKVKDSDEVLDNWDEIKKREKGQTTVTETLKAVPKVFPGLMRSQKVQKRAAKSGFDYPDISAAIADLEHELAELKEALARGDKAGCFEETGDLLFSAVNIARLQRIDAEESITVSCEKFIDRFDRVEKQAIAENLDMHNASLDKLNSLWDAAKHPDGSK